MEVLKKLTFFLLFLSMGLAQAAQQAVVRRTKAKIYADKELMSPIGYVSRGKVLKVGEKKHRNGTIIPIVVSGRIAWIKTEDVALEQETNFQQKKEQIHEHDVDVNFKSDQDLLSENNYLNFSYRPVSIDSPLANTPASVPVEESYSISHFGVYFEHRVPNNKYHWGFGFSQYSLDTEIFSFSATSFEATLSRVLYSSGFVSAELNGALVLSGAASIESKEAYTEPFQDVGQAWGYRAGGLLKFFPYDQYGFLAGVHLEALNLTSVYPITYNNGTSDELDSLSGQSVFIGFSYKL